MKKDEFDKLSKGKPAKKKDVLYIAGLISKGKDKGKFVAIEVRNTLLLNPVQPIFDQYPDMECVVIGKSQAAVKKNFEKLIK